MVRLKIRMRKNSNLNTKNLLSQKKYHFDKKTYTKG